MFLEEVNLLGELALACSGGAGEQDRVGRAHSDAFDGLDELVKGGIMRVDSAFQEREIVLAFGFEALGELVVAREVEVDDRVRALRVVGVADMSLLRGRLDQFCAEVVGLGEEEETNLLYVRACGDVDVIARSLLMKAGKLGVVVEFLVNLLEVPRILQLDDVEDNLRFRRYLADVGFHALGERRVLAAEDQMQLVDWQVVLLDKPDGRPPRVPARRPRAAVCILLCPKDRYDRRFHADSLPNWRIPVKKVNISNSR